MKSFLWILVGVVLLVGCFQYLHNTFEFYPKDMELFDFACLVISGIWLAIGVTVGLLILCYFLFKAFGGKFLP